QRTAGLQHFGARGGAAKLAQLQPGAVQGGGGGRLQGLRQGPLARVLGAALAVLHDEAVVRLGGLQCRGVDHRVGGREGGLRAECEGGGGGGGKRLSAHGTSGGYGHADTCSEEGRPDVPLHIGSRASAIRATFSVNAGSILSRFSREW